MAWSGSLSASTSSGKPRNIVIASAVNSRECTNETWMATGQRRRTSAATDACGR